MDSPEFTTSRAASVADDDVLELVDYCARPLCRHEFRRVVTRGRRKAYCSDICRRTAERELRQAKSRLAHFRGVVEQLQADVAAFGRSDSDDGLGDTDALRREATQAIARATGVAAFLPDADDPVAQEFRILLGAVGPVLSVEESERWA